MTNLHLYGTSPHLMALLHVVFQGNDHFQLVGASHNRRELINHLSAKEVDVLLLSHEGVLDFNVLTFVNDFHPNIQVVGIQCNELLFRQKKLSRALLSKVYPAHEQTLEKYLQAFETIHFQMFNNTQNQKEYEHLLLHSDEAHCSEIPSGSAASVPPL